MNKVIVNLSRNTVKTNYRGHEIIIKPKCSFVPEDEGMYHYLLDTYGFLVDRTPKVNYKVTEIKQAKGVKVR